MPSTSGIQEETESTSSQDTQNTEGENETVPSQSSQSTSSTVPEREISIWLDEKEEQNAKRQVLNDSMNNLTDGRLSPLQSTLDTEWDDISATLQKCYTRKARETIAATLSVISPGQEEELWQSILREPLLQSGDHNEGSKRKYFDINSDLIDSLIKAHNEAESWQTKRQILSLFANDFSRSELQSLIPGLSKWRIDQARSHAVQTGKGKSVKEKFIYRARIESAKVDHFLDYISRPELLQDVALDR